MRRIMTISTRIQSTRGPLEAFQNVFEAIHEHVTTHIAWRGGKVLQLINMSNSFVKVGSEGDIRLITRRKYMGE